MNALVRFRSVSSSVRVATVLWLLLVLLASGCGPGAGAPPAATRAPVKQAVKPVLHGILRTQDVSLTQYDVVVFLKGCTKSGTSETCIDLTPTDHGARVQSSDSNVATFRGADYVLSFPPTTDLSKPQNIQARATGYISVNARVKLNNAGPTYINGRMYVTGTRAGGTENSIAVEDITSLDVTPATATITGGTKLALSLTGNGGAIVNPTVNVSDQGGTIAQLADGSYEYTAGNVMGTFQLTFDSGAAQTVATITIAGYQQPVTAASIPPQGLTVTAIDSVSNSVASVTLPQGVTVTDAQGNVLPTVTITLMPLASPFVTQALGRPLGIQQVTTLANADNLGTAYEFGPSGSQFNPPVQVSLSYDPLLLGDLPTRDLEVGYFDTGLADWVTLAGTAVDTQNQIVSGQAQHFTKMKPQGHIASIVITPAAAALQPGGTQAFTAIGYDDEGNAVNLHPTWDMSNPEPGSITAGNGNDASQATFTAGSTPTSGTVKATDHGVEGSASVAVVGPVVPSTTSLQLDGIGATADFTASQAFATAPVSAPSTCLDGSGRTIATIANPSAGNFTATAAATGTCSLTLSGQAGLTASLTITSVGQVRVSPSSLELAGSTGTGSFTASQDGTGTPVNVPTACLATDSSTVATVSGGNGSYTMQAVKAGTCSLTISGELGASATLSAAVTVTRFNLR